MEMSRYEVADYRILRHRGPQFPILEPQVCATLILFPLSSHSFEHAQKCNMRHVFCFLFILFFCRIFYFVCHCCLPFLIVMSVCSALSTFLPFTYLLGFFLLFVNFSSITQILFKYPPGKKVAMRPKDLATFCFPGGVKV